MMKNILFIILMPLTAMLCCERINKTEILWDKHGIPHIYGKNAEEMYHAFGYAQMNNHANLMLQLYGQARGKASEYWGETYLNSDRKIMLFGLPEIAADNYMNMDREYKAWLEAFVKGINDYALRNPETIDEKLRPVLPVTPVDVLSHTIRVIWLEFLASEDINNSVRLIEAGSNSIAIAPSRSASKNAMLITNPHSPWSDFFTWFEAHLNTRGYNAYGIGLVGTAPLSMAFNNNLGWTFTINPIDASDRYEIQVKNDGYILDGNVLPFEEKVSTIKVKQADGTIKEQQVSFKYSKHGPVVGQKGNKAYAVRIAGLQNPGLFEQFHKMSAANTLDEFESAMKMLQLPMFNVVYADRPGNILYLFNGNVPERNEGDFAFWRGTIDGSKSEFIWEQILQYEDLPRVLNPSSGFIQNCNDPPWTCTEPPELKPENFPAYMAPRGTFMRPQRAVNMIKDNHSISFDQLITYKHDTGMEAAERFLDDLLAAVEKYPEETAVKAADILRNWDKKTEAGSRGAVLFAHWWNMVNSSLFEVPWNAEKPNVTPDGIKDQKKAVEMLVRAAGDVSRKYGSPDVAWGDIYRLRHNGIDLPANGGSGDYGIFRTIYFADDIDNKMRAIAGETYIAVTEFGDKVRAEVLLSYGNATQPGNKHSGDQLKMLSEKKLRPALLERREILENLEKKEIINTEVLNDTRGY